VDDDLIWSPARRLARRHPQGAPPGAAAAPGGGRGVSWAGRQLGGASVERGVSWAGRQLGGASVGRGVSWAGRSCRTPTPASAAPSEHHLLPAARWRTPNLPQRPATATTEHRAGGEIIMDNITSPQVTVFNKSRRGIAKTRSSWTAFAPPCLTHASWTIMHGWVGVGTCAYGCGWR
jgi:hypothetical protein